jgi:tRNA(adenine34) deaminase
VGSYRDYGLYSSARWFIYKKCERNRTIAASKKVSPKGPASGMRMLTYFINRAGRGLSESRRNELEKAKVLLSKRIHTSTNQKKAA